MTELQILEIKTAQDYARQVESNGAEQLRERVIAAKKVVRDLETHCDHRLPDGSSADEGGYAYGFCSICNQVNPQ